MVTNKNIDIPAIKKLLGEVHDPEVPVLSILDLGIVRDVRIGEGQAAPQSDGQYASPGGPANNGQRSPGREASSGEVEVIITPTYSGCPAMDVIRMQIRMVLAQHGYDKVKVTTVLSPAWTTEWMSQEGKDKLKAYGIAPPNPMQQVCEIRPFHRDEAVQCPHCGSYHTNLISEFGSTACKALYKCADCKEPFDYFKCH
jgi:ring-1,2-phenylacetyl-CoA epoxidase subunit PaaD